MSNMAQKRRRFSREFKSEIVHLVLSGQKNVSQISQEHGIHESSLYAWVNQAKVDSGVGPAGALTSAEKSELAALRREVRELKRERDFLAQATAYFAQAKK